MTQITLKLETLTTCPICGGTDYEPYNLTVWLGGKLYYYLCNTCGVFFLNPRMCDDQLGEYYAGMYRDSLQVINRSDEVISKEDQTRQELRARAQMELCGEYFAGRKTSLEIGCSMGMLMDALAGIGVTPDGVEPDERYRIIDPACKYRTYADISQVIPQPYDLICMSHSLEHLNHPLDYIRNLVEHYAHDGTRFMIEVPNAEKNIVERPHHPFGFTKFALDWLMAQVGHKPLSKRVYHGLTNMIAQNYLLVVYGK